MTVPSPKWLVYGGVAFVGLSISKTLYRQLTSISRGARALFIRDPIEFESKKRKIIADGFQNLQVISDYDSTITKPNTLGSWGVLERSGKMSQSFFEKTAQYCQKYYPIEVSPHMTIEEKIPFMLEWWNSSHTALLEEKLSYNKMKAIVSSVVNQIEYRNGYEEFFGVLAKVNVPVLIFSAGLGDTIRIALNLKGISKEDQASTDRNVHVISNFFYDEHDKDTIPTSFNRGSIIHVFNKNEVVMKQTPFYSEVVKRRNVILLGDSLGDIGMAEGIPHDCVLKIGFFNALSHKKNKADIDALLEKYKAAFDVLLVNDFTFNWTNELLKQIK